MSSENKKAKKAQTQINKEEKVEVSETKKRGWSVSMWLYLLLVAIGGFFLGFWVGNSFTLEISSIFMKNASLAPGHVEIGELNNAEILGTPAAAYGSDEKDAMIVRVFSNLQNDDDLSFILNSISKIAEENAGARVEYFDFPKSSDIHAGSIAAYARCAVKNNVDYIDYVKALLENNEKLQNDSAEPVVNDELLSMAVALGANEDEMNKCVISGEMQKLTAENKSAIIDNELFGSHLFMVGNKVYSGSINKTGIEKLMEEYTSVSAE